MFLPELNLGQAKIEMPKIENVRVSFRFNETVCLAFTLDGYFIDFDMEDVTEVQRLAKIKEFAGVHNAKELEGKELRWIGLYAVGHPTEDRFVCLHGDTQELTMAELLQKFSLTLHTETFH